MLSEILTLVPPASGCSHADIALDPLLLASVLAPGGGNSIPCQASSATREGGGKGDNMGEKLRWSSHIEIPIPSKQWPSRYGIYILWTGMTSSRWAYYVKLPSLVLYQPSFGLIWCIVLKDCILKKNNNNNKIKIIIIIIIQCHIHAAIISPERKWRLTGITVN